MRSCSAQTSLSFDSKERRGGARDGAGRKRTSRCVAHRRREGFASKRAIHVTLRMDKSVWRLRARRMYSVLYNVFCRSARQPGFRLIHFSVQNDHLHCVVEAKNRAAMTSGMRHFTIRIARRLNKAMGRKKGSVLPDRYHEHFLRTPTEIKHALGYVLCNFRKHYLKDHGGRCEPRWLDPMSSAHYFTGWRNGPLPVPIQDNSPVAAPTLYLLTKGWRSKGLVPLDFVPGTSRRVS